MYFTLLVILLNATGSVSGFVTDASNGERLAYTNIYLENTILGTASNDKGYYIIHKIPPGSYQIVYSYIGYENVSRDIIVEENRNLTLNVELDPSAIEVEEITVSAERTRFEQTVEVSHIMFTPREISSVPRLFEGDLIKTLQLMPGVVTMHDLSNKLHVRGGSPDENLVLLDGITVYNPSTHLGGLFSTFNPDAVGFAELYAGGFPANYGDRLSSVLSVNTKEGNSKDLTGMFSFGLVTSRLLVEGPIPKGSFLVSARRSYFDALVWLYDKIRDDDISLPYYFYDFIGKVNFNPSPENRFTLAGLSSTDVLDFQEIETEDPDERIGLEWGNRGVSLRWRSVFTPKFYGEIVGAWSNFLTQLRYEDLDDSTENLNLYEDIIDYTAKCDFNYFWGENHTMEFGIEGKYSTIGYNWDFEEEISFDQEHQISVIASYIKSKIFVIPSVLSIQPGIRSIYYSKGKRLCLDPRFGIKYLFRPNTAFNFALGKYSQFLVTVNSQESYFSIFDFWRPVDETQAIPTAYHAIAGFEQWFDEKTKFTIEPYYKKYYNLLIPTEDDIYFSAPTESLQLGDGYSAGIDLFFKKTLKNVFGWISYSLSFTKRRFDGDYYSPRYDRRHNMNIVIGFTIPQYIPLLKNGTLSTRWYMATGLPHGLDIARYQYYYWDPRWGTGDYDWEIISSARDAYRLPLSHRLDLHLEKNMKIFGLKGSWYIDVINVYNRKNIAFYTVDYDEDPPEINKYVLLPIPIPSFGFNLTF
ncbi:MAG: TonB-dependent receptor [candidate division WOR-3 bacterium]|nr:MAG: TonB-dependent receptor [candidate division WOR-3 bacterium]